jgi:hypothetical protein
VVLVLTNAQYPVITASEPASARYLSPHPNYYQNYPSAGVYNRSPSLSTPSPNPDASSIRRNQQSPAGAQPDVKDPKGKKKAHGAGRDPLEIAYGQTIGTHTKPLTTDDFQVDTEHGQHKPQQEPAGFSYSHGEDSDERPKRTSPSYGVEGEDEFRNVWDR